MIRVLPFLFATSLLWADTVIERTSMVKTTRLDGGVETSPCRERVSIREKNVRIEDLDLAEAWVFRMDKGLLWYIDLRALTYAEVPFEMVHARRAELVQQLQECARRVTDGDLNARYAEMLAQLGEGAKDPPTITPNGQKDQVAGQPCEHLLASEGKRPILDALVAKGLPGATEYDAAMGKIEAFPAAVSEAFAKDALFLMKGKVRMTFLLSRVERTDEVTKVDAHATVDPKLFDLPEGLKKVELPGFETDRGPKDAPKGGFEKEEGK